MRFFVAYLKKQRHILAFFLLCTVIQGSLIYLYEVPMAAAGYGLLLCFFFGGIFGGMGYYRFCKKMEQMERLKQEVSFTIEHLPDADNLLEQQYQECLKLLQEEKIQLISQEDKERTDMVDYYSLWAHQIKTPIAAMGLILQGMQEKSPEVLEVENELFRIQQYVDMVLSYLRIGSKTNDFVFQKTALERVVKDVVHKYARQFIRRKLSLNMAEFHEIVLTDEKWLSFVIEQILSNALKYTRRGSVSIYIEGAQSLVIEDTGIGIAKEDLPRICEKGYTGYNGRDDKKSTGIGLYLCKIIMEKLGHGMTVTSELGVGTKVTLDLKAANLTIE